MEESTQSKTDNQSWLESLWIKSLLAGMTFFTSALNLIVAITNLLSGKPLIAIIAFLGVVFFITISIIVFSLRSVQKNNGIKTQRDYDEFIGKVSKSTHDILHRIRNNIYYIEMTYKNNPNITAQEFEQNITQYIMSLLDCMADIYKKILGTDVRICIKCLDYTGVDEDNPSKMNIITFARSGYQDIFNVMKEHRIPIKIEDNTDFSEIVQSANNKRQRQYFYEKNLKDFNDKLNEQGRKYKNSNEMWENDYITTIVCPIRLRLNPSDDLNALTYRLIGFLCIDSLDENAFDNIYSDFCFDLLKGVSDILYVFLDQFIIFYNKLLKKEGKAAL